MILSDMRSKNRNELFDLVRQKREVTRAELQECTGYSSPFIMNIVNEFIEKGILTLTGKRTGSVGRRPYTMVFNPDVFISIGIEFAESYILAGIVNLDGDIHYQIRQQIETADENLFKPINECIDRLMQISAANGIHCQAVGVGIPGSIAHGNRKIRLSRKLAVFGETDDDSLFRQVKEKYQIPVFLENDANARALGEYYLRWTANPVSDLLFVLYSNFGLGASLVLNGKLRKGISHHAGEIGASVRDTDAIVQYGKSGWLEDQISRQALIERFGIDVETDEISEEIIDYIAKMMSPFIANILNMLDFSQVVMGGRMLDLCGDTLIDKIQEYVGSLTFENAVVEKTKTEYSGVVGSALMASHLLGDILL